MSNSLWPRGLQHARLPCPSLSPRVSQTLVCWVGDTIQPSHPLLTPFFSCLQSFPASGSFPVSWPFASGGQNIGDSASASVLPMSIQGWFPLRLTGLISLLPKGLSGVFFSTTVRRHLSPLALCLLYGPAFTAVHGLWENHILENADLFRNNVSTFQHTT